MKISIRERFNKWCKTERMGRAEEGTSQDMCPTNGDALFMTMYFSIAPMIILVIFITGNV